MLSPSRPNGRVHMEHLIKKPRTSPGKPRNSRWDMASSNHSPNQSLNMAGPRPERQQTETAIVQVPTSTFRTRCTHCNAPWLCSTNATGWLVRCQTCRRLFDPKGFPVDANLAAQRTSSTPWALRNSGFSSNGDPAQRREHHGAHNQVKESDAKIGAMSVIKSPLAEEFQEKGFKPEETVPNSKAATDRLFRQGVQLMLKAFVARAEGASHDELGELRRYGKIILQSTADLGIVDPGLGAFIENLSQQAADVTARRSSVSLSEAAHTSSTETTDAIHQEKLKALALATAADEEVCAHMKMVERANAALTEAREKEEMAKKARIQAEQDLDFQEQHLADKKASRNEAKEAFDEKENELAKAKLEQLNAEREMLKRVEELKSSENKWKTLCEQAPGVKDWVL